jgi:hypothetical protein
MVLGSSPWLARGDCDLRKVKPGKIDLSGNPTYQELTVRATTLHHQ